MVFERYECKSHKQFNEFLKNKNTILDAGTGVWNSAYMLSANSNSQVFALDASESIDFAYKNMGKSLIFISYKLIFVYYHLIKIFFDFIYSISEKINEFKKIVPLND